MKQIKWGVLGTANIAKGHTIPAMLKAENCRLYGIAGRSKEKVEEFKALFGFEKAYYSYEAMLEDDAIEAVYIPLPNTLHKEWVLKAAAKKKHILCEKPLSGTEADVKEMIQACDDAGVYFMEAFAYLHTPIIKSVKEALDSGVIGKPTFIETTFLTPRPSKDNIRVRRDTLGGAIYDLGCYNISLILTMLGEEPSEVKALANFTDQNIDDFVAAYFEFPSGCRASLITGMCSGQRADRYFIHGTEGTIEAPIPFNIEGTVKYYIHKNGVTEEIVVDVPNNYMLELEQLGRCIIDGEQPYVSHEFSVKNARTMDRVLTSMGYNM
ncbi:MAG: aldo/keto reductase [Herbinix sp.]|jgi:predicted dehydrogenase|nr:aldo/keto reductase [Herbinix sp.]